MTLKEKWNAVKQNDETCDGMFFYAVKTTGIFCRPSCKSRLPKRDNVEFFDTSDEALEAGYRPCKRCRPDLLEYKPVKEVAEKAKQLIDNFFAAKHELDEEIRRLGVTQHRMIRIFKEQYGVTPSEYMNELRIHEAKSRLAATGESIIDIAYSVGFNSLSAFYRLFRRMTGVSPANYRKTIGRKTT